MKLLKRKTLRILAGLALQLILGLLLLEIALRMSKPYHKGLRALLYRATVESDYSAIDSLPELFQTTPQGYNPCGQVHGSILNSRSFRTKEYEETMPGNGARVLLIGDSFTYGVVPQADLWGTLLEKSPLDHEAGPVEVLNLGVPSTGVPFQLRLWELEGARLHPDLVILGFFVGNDFFDELGNSLGWQGWSDRLALVSYSYRAIRNTLRLGRAGTGPAFVPTGEKPLDSGCGYELPAFADAYRDDWPTMTEEAYAHIEAERMGICLEEDRWKLGIRLARVGPLLRKFSEEVTQAGSRFVVLIMPDEFQVDVAVRAQAAEAAGRGLVDYDIALPQRELRRYLESNDIAYVDLLAEFQRQSSAGRLYIPRDSHWNRQGNRLAAEVLIEHLQRQPDP